MPRYARRRSPDGAAGAVRSTRLARRAAAPTPTRRRTASSRNRSCGLALGIRRLWLRSTMLMLDERTCLVANVARALLTHRPLGELHEVGVVKDPHQAIMWQRLRPSGRREQFGTCQRERRVTEPVGDILTKHVHHERNMAAALARLDQTKGCDALEVLLRSNVRINRRCRRPIPPTTAPPPPESDNQRERRGQRCPEPPWNHRPFE